MQVFNLPKDLNTSTNGKVQLYNYKSGQDHHKTKVNLSKHIISFLRSGTKEVIGKGQAQKIDHQHFLMMKAGHCLMSETMPNPNKIYQSILFFFDDSMALDFLEKYDLSAFAKEEESSFYVFQYDEFIQYFVQSLESMTKLPAATQQQLLQPKFEEIMLYLCAQNGPAFLNTIVHKVDDRISRLTNVVDSNKLNKLSLEELAFLCNMSLSTFKREFFKVYQTTPMKWFNEQRLKHSATILKSQQKRPIDLYEEAGYESFSNFVQAFKKRFGLTPKQYQSQA